RPTCSTLFAYTTLFRSPDTTGGTRPAGGNAPGARQTPPARGRRRVRAVLSVARAWPPVAARTRPDRSSPPSAEEPELDDEQGRQQIEAEIEITPATGQQLDRGPGNEAQGNAVGDGEGQGHHQRRYHHRGGFGQVFPVHLNQAAGHQHGNEEQCRCGGKSRDRAGQRRQEQTQQEQGGHYAGGQTSTATDSGARGGFDVAGGGGCAQQGAEHGGSAVSHQGAAQTRQLAVLVHQIGLLGHTDQGARGVEQVDEQEGEDHRDQTHVQRSADIQFEEG